MLLVCPWRRISSNSPWSYVMVKFNVGACLNLTLVFTFIISMSTILSLNLKLIVTAIYIFQEFLDPASVILVVDYYY